MSKHHPFTNIRGDIYYPEQNSGGSYLSQLERDEFIYWMIEPEVVNVVLQPKPRKPYVQDGKPHEYTPDLFVNFSPASKRHSLYIECKYSDQLRKDPTLDVKHDCIKRALHERGEHFVVRTEKDTYDETFSARRFLLFMRDDPPDEEAERLILAELESTGEIEVGSLLQRLSSDRRRQLQIVSQVWRLAAWRRIQISLTPLLNEHTRVQPTCSRKR